MFSITVDIAAPPEHVWRVLVRQPKLPAALWRITEIDDGRSFTWISRGAGIVATAPLVHSSHESANASMKSTSQWKRKACAIGV